MRRRLVGGSERGFGGANGLFELFELAAGFFETIAETPDERVELANELVLKGQLDLDVFEALGQIVGGTVGHARTVSDATILPCAL
jgi:hypothetical protein